MLIGLVLVKPVGDLTSHEECAYAVNMSVEIELVDFEFVDFIISSGNYSRLTSLNKTRLHQCFPQARIYSQE